MKALIIEDEDLAATRLIQLLKKLEPSLELIGPIDSIEDAVKHLQQSSLYDLIFLDIQLADGKSFSIFEKVSITVPVIFTTAYDEYAIKAFDLNCVDYLLKPININKLRNSLDKFKKVREFYVGDEINRDLLKTLQSFQKQSTVQIYKSRFLVNKGDVLIPVTSIEIAYFYAEDKVVFLVTRDNKKYLINHTLEDLEQKLDPHLFFRVNRQVITSVDAIQKVHNYFNYKLKLDMQPNHNAEIIVSKAKTGEFKAWMNGER